MGIEVTSFYGTDGSGKSTIAREYSRSVLWATRERAVVLGGSSYKEWLTRGIARSVFGNHNALDEPANTPLEKQKLYENIAIVLYGYASRLQQSGHVVAIDSDAFLKRYAWAALENDPSQLNEYLRLFNDRVSGVVGEDSGPKNIVGVNVRGVDADLLGRIKARGGVSEFDPQSDESMRDMDATIMRLWSDIESASAGHPTVLPGIDERFAGVRILELSNPDCSPDVLPIQVRRLGQTAFDWAVKAQ